MRSWQVSIGCGVALMLVLVAIAGAAAPDLSGVWRIETLTVELNRDGTGYAGAIRLGDQSFALTAREAGGNITGAFSASGTSFNFTATADGDTMTLTSDNARHVLKRAVNAGVKTDETGRSEIALAREADSSA